MFELTGDGRRYLRGEMDASHRWPIKNTSWIK